MLPNKSGINGVARTVKRVALGVTSVVLCWSSLNLEGKANAAQFSVLWWDTTPWYHGVLADKRRQEMSDFLDDFGGGDIFDTTYISHKTGGGLQAHLASHSYDVVVLDSQYHPSYSPTFPFNSADQEALKQHYTQKSNLMLDGSLTIRNLKHNLLTDFPGPNNAFGNFTANQVYALARRGGGIFIGTDHDAFQGDGNYMLDGLFPEQPAKFSGITYPSTDGIFYGADLLDSAVAVAPNDIFAHWDSISTQGVAPTGDFIDFLGNSVTLYSQVDVANKPGGGPKYSYISTSWKPDECETAVTGTSSACNPEKVPEPSALLGLLAVGAVGSLLKRR
ncbi:PEP-CTERM sorting domain-containing protein [Roseofilum sp. Guam]|uniref:PEP-CTERM sorting domain-containing protein n=1 Tax=Roseofilum sp. Guam TaxID=2821502 RepID=UPI001B0E4F53|nr:PEP-CTERM sorting domain-containing protein [Roseofilum sp. Guam]MBP0030422.1 PEP-CTERM sorting domain-containing protein [Roseofilum sp. Guam]